MKEIIKRWWPIVALAVYLIIITLNFKKQTEIDNFWYESVLKQIRLIENNRIQSERWKSMYDSVTIKYQEATTFINRKKASSQKIHKQNEINKKRAVSTSDSIAVFINDSLRTRYIETFKEKGN